jgi:hypothetical protein
MADMEINAVITFTDGQTMEVQSTVGQITGAIRGATNPHIPLAKVVDERGRNVWINADHIRSIEAYERGERF